MAFFNTSKDEEVLNTERKSKFINRTGFYPVTLVKSFVSVGNKGSECVDFLVDLEGQEQVLYGNVRLTNNDGSSNDIGTKIFNSLLVIADIESIEDTEEEEIPIGKGGELVSAPVLTELDDFEVVVHIQMRYSKWKDKIRESKDIKGFYRIDDFATAKEIVNDEGHGETYEKEVQLATDMYKDGLTEEEVSEWIKSGRGKKTAKSDKPSAPKKRTFGKK
ncbi:hypothetical protein [Candidatus Macondimonas diazotrophica]|uniref:Uncharacterized protein n=1 Tax=Candidatus Macondimonas diazotrophica TaxID=2305248 RepID=A0A4Z0F713_9GAMM|nr:hypothetical protein [Candidatus Macondimonas diazotrophica]TFZ81435.1 hypothetical protein E4680_12530 [Candidatus Macondimonas diazotrophica]